MWSCFLSLTQHTMVHLAKWNTETTKPVFDFECISLNVFVLFWQFSWSIYLLSLYQIQGNSLEEVPSQHHTPTICQYMQLLCTQTSSILHRTQDFITLLLIVFQLQVTNSKRSTIILLCCALGHKYFMWFMTFFLQTILDKAPGMQITWTVMEVDFLYSSTFWSGKSHNDCIWSANNVFRVKFWKYLFNLLTILDIRVKKKPNKQTTSWFCTLLPSHCSKYP